MNKKVILTTSDMLIENIHFDRAVTTFYQLGYKCLAVNVSDIFAMGGMARYFLLNLGIPENINTEDIHELYAGMHSLAKKLNISIIGGDTCASHQGILILSGTLLGETDKIIFRSGARPNDNVYVTGYMGDSAAGLALLQKYKKKVDLSQSSVFSSLYKRHLMPEPRCLMQIQNITSMIDISDGLLQDLSHICDKSNVGARIYLDKLPVSDSLIEASRILGKDPLDFALKGGEDYELLFTQPHDSKKECFQIGVITESDKTLIDHEGQERPFDKNGGYDHFQKDSEHGL